MQRGAPSASAPAGACRRVRACARRPAGWAAPQQLRLTAWAELHSAGAQGWEGRGVPCAAKARAPG
eukprot:5730519-Prymnesium_polylepis.1